MEGGRMYNLKVIVCCALMACVAGAGCMGQPSYVPLPIAEASKGLRVHGIDGDGAKWRLMGGLLVDYAHRFAAADAVDNQSYACVEFYRRAAPDCPAFWTQYPEIVADIHWNVYARKAYDIQGLNVRTTDRGTVDDARGRRWSVFDAVYDIRGASGIENVMAQPAKASKLGEHTEDGAFQFGLDRVMSQRKDVATSGQKQTFTERVYVREARGVVAVVRSPVKRSFPDAQMQKLLGAIDYVP